MANSIEVEVRLGLLSALNLISTLRKALEQSLDVKSSSFTSLTRELDSALKSVNRLRTQMSTAFLTSSGSSKFLLEYNKVVDLIDTVINSFSTINLDHLKLPEEILTLVKELKTNLLLTESEIKRILSGKVGKIFSNDTIKDFSLVREAAKLLRIDLSKETFDSFALKLSEGADIASKKVTELSNKIKNLEELANNATLKKDSVINSITSDSHYAEMTLRRLTLTSAESLRNLLKTIYLGFLGLEVSGLISKTINLNIKAKSNIDSIFSALKDLIEKSSDDLIAEIERKRTAIAEAIATLTAINKLNAVDANGTRYNRESRLAVVDSIKELFKNLNLDFGSDAGKGIHEYLNSVIQTLTDYSKNLNFSEVTNNFKTAITQALLSATTVDTISDTKAFGDKVKALLISIFGLAFDINYALFNGSSITDAFEIIFNTIQNQAQNIDLSSLRELLKSVEDAQKEYANASAVVQAAGKEDLAALEGLQKAAENLSATLTKLLQDTLGLAAGAIGKGMEEDRKKILQTLSTLENYISSASKIEKTNLSLTNVSSAVGRWMGFYQVLNLTKRAILDMKTHVQELDKVMTLIAVVTNMSQDDLWGQISTYSNIARLYGVAIKGVYEVSLIYYQQGLNQNDTMTLTTETLKMARIAGIDYATAADYMTTAIRGFKLEMSEAAHVTDVFSNLAAHTASDTEELATAISKTASSAEAVGSSFEATSAMIATMVSVTRESATNIGTALKSVISRYGEMTADPSKLVDSEGEEMSLNRVDAALKTIGITILDTKGQFRDFDDVILELADKWDSLDKNSQRYIATLMAGNRQQSRFLALVGNVEEYRKALDLANNSEDTGELLTLKTLDSIDAKIERMKVTIQEFYTSSGILDLYKTILDTITNAIDGANNLPKAFSNIPVWAIALGALIIAVVKNVALLTIVLLLNSLSLLKQGVSTNLTQITQEGANLGRLFGKRWREAAKAEIDLLTGPNANGLQLTKAFFLTNKGRLVGTMASTLFSAIGAGASLKATLNYGASTSADQDVAAALTMGWGAGLNAISGAISGGMMAGPWGAAAGAIISGLPAIISAINMGNVTLSRRLELAEKAETLAKQEATVDKGKVNDLQQAYDKLSQLLSEQYESIEAMAEYHDYMNLLADSYPALVSAMEINGDLIVTLESLERALANARADAAASTLAAVNSEKNRLLLLQLAWEKLNESVSSTNLTLQSDEKPVDKLASMLRLGNFDEATTQYKSNNDDFPLISSIENSFEAIITAYELALKLLPDYENLLPLVKQAGQSFEEIYALNLKLLEDFAIQATQSYASIYSDTDTLKGEYKLILKEAIENNKDLSYELLTGNDKVKTAGDIDALNYDELVAAIQNTRELALDGINKIGSDINNHGKLISSSSAGVIVLNRLKQNSKTANGIDLNSYSSFISSMMSRYKSDIDFSETGVNSKLGNDLYDELVKYIEKHLSLADDLILNLNYSLISSIQELNNFLLSHNFTTKDGINANIIASIQKDYLTSMQSIRTNFYGAIKSYVGQFTEGSSARDLWRLFDQSNTKDNITGEVASILQSLLPQYLKLLDNGYTTAAETYLNGLIKVYLMVGTFGDEDQTKITDTLRSLDLTDTEAIDSAIEQFTEQGFVELVNILQEVRGRIATNLTLTISQMTSEAVDLVGEAEKVIGNVGKGMEYSDALKAAQEIINKSEDKSRIASDSVKFNSDLGQWVLTSNILNESYTQLVEAYNDKLADVDKLLKVAESFVKDSVLDITSKEDINVTAEDFDINWEELTGLTKGTELYEAAVANEIARFNASLLQLYDQYESGAKDTKWEEYLTKHYEELNLGKIELEAAKKWLQNSAFTALAKLDYSAIITGAASDFDKENFIIYLRMISEELGTQADTLWLNLLDGKFDEFEKAIGLTLSDKTKSEALTAKVELYLTAIDELLDDSVTTFSENTAALLDGKTKQSMSPALIGAYASKFILELNSLLEEGKVTLEQYNNAIARAKAKQYGDHSSDIQALGEAASMTFESLGSLLTLHGKKLNEELKKSYYKIANGKVQVTDFKAFATDLGIDTNSEDYLTAFKQYNQGLIELDRKTASVIKDEISSIINLKPGERIDVSRLSHELGKNFNQVLVQYGGILNDGILTLSDNANIPGMIQAIIAEVLSSSNEAIQLTSAEVAELLDAVTSYISDIVNLITNGMSGSLTNAQAQLLNSWASQNGVGQVDFIRTNEGIKLTEDAFFNLYGTLSTIDKRMAKKLIPDMTKLSTRYSNLLSVLREYESAQKDSIKRLAMRELASSMLRDPKSYNLLGSEMPQTWQIADSFYGNIPKAMQITNKMANTGSVSAEEFSSLMQSIMLSSNKGDALQALEWMQMAPDFFYETADGTLMIDTAAMGIKNLKELNRMWEDAFEEVRLLGDNELKVYNELYYGSESLERAKDIWKDDGSLDASKLKELIDSKTQLGNNIKALLDKYKLGNQTLYDSLSETTDTELRNRIIKKLSTIDWNYDDFESQIAESLEELGLGGKIRFDSDGNYEVIIEPSSSNIDIFYEAEGKTLTKDSYSKWIAAKAKAEMQGDGKVTTEDTTEGTENSINYTIKGYKITVTLDAEGNILYSCDVGGDWGIITATSESGLKAAIAATVGMTGSDETIDGSDKNDTITINNATYTIQYNSDGTVKVIMTDNGDEKLQEQMEALLNAEAQKAADETSTTVEGGDVTITPSAVNIIVDESTPVTIGALTKDKVDVNVTNVDVTSTNPPTTDNLNIDNIPYDKQTNVKLSNIITENTSEPDNSNIFISPFTYSDGVWVTISDLEAFAESVNTDNIVIDDIDYEALNAVINEVKASYEGTPNIDNVKLSDTGLTYDKLLGLVLMDLLLSSEAGKTVFNLGTITLDDKTELRITDVVNALLAGTVKLNSGENGVTVAADSYVTLEDGSKVDLPEGTIVDGDLINSKIKLTGEGVDAETGSITLKDGTTVTIDEVIGKVMKVIAQWAAGAKKTPDFKNDLNLPTTYDAPPGVITLELLIKYELTDDLKRKLEESYLRIDKQLAGYKINPSKTGSFDKWALGGKNGTDWKVNLNELGAYVQVLKDLASAGQILSEVELHNLQGLTDYDNLPENISEMALAAINLSNSNSSNLSGAIDNLKLLDTISGENLTLVVNSLEALASAATLLQSINWSAIAQGINSLNNPAHPVEAENLGGKEGLTADVTLILLTEGALAAFNKLKQKLVLPKILVLGNTNPLYNAVKNLKLPDKVVKVVYDESSKPAGATGNVLLTSKQSERREVNAVYGAAAGNVALAGGRKTLMGELGPELYVTNGHYYIAGQSGAEFVDLPEDAIVFNHLLTARLLNNGKTGHGKAVVNERKAVGEAHAFSANKITDQDTSKVDNAVLDAAGEVILAAKVTVHVREAEAKKREDNYLASLLNNYVASLKDVKDIINKYATEGKINAEELTKLLDFIKVKVDDVMPKGANFDTKNEIRKAYAETASAVNTVIKGVEAAAAAQRAAALAASDAAKALEEAANQLQQEDKEPTKSQNDYATVQTPRGIVHPGAAPKLKDVFLGNAPSTPTSSSGGSGGRSSAGTPRGTGNSLGKTTAEMKNLLNRSSGSGSASADVEKEVKEAKSAVSNFLSDLLERGIESIDLSKYENLPAALKAEILGKIDKNTSYRDFVLAYAGALDQSMSEINSTYFLAWQKDLETVGMAEELMDALEGLSMYLDGTIGGQADDWVTLLGDKAFVGDAVEAGVLQWDADLRQYVATSQLAVMDFMNTDLGMVWNFPDVLVDNTLAVIDEINELMEKAISGEGLTSKEKSRLEALLKKSNYTGTAEFNKNANGKFGITSASATEIAASISGSDDTIVDESQKVAQDALSAIIGAVENSEITREMGNTIEQWLVAQGSSLEEMGIKKTDTGYSIGFDSIIKSIETFGKDNKDQIILLLSGIDTSNLSDTELGQLETTLTSIFGDSAKALIASIKDNLIGRAKGIMDIVSSGFGEGKSINLSLFTELSDSLSKMGLNINDFTFGTDAEGNFTASWETIRLIYEQMATKYPEAAKAFIKNISDDELTADEKKAKADMLKAAGDIKGANKVLDAMVSAAGQVTSTMAKAFGEGNYITNEEYTNINEFLKNAGHKELSLTQTSEGYIASFEDITEVFNDLVKDYPALAKDLLKNISDDELTKELRELKAKMLASVNEVSASAKTLDSIVETRANVISLLVKSASKEGISNSDYAQLITKFRDAYGIDLNIDFTKTDSGYSATVELIMQLYDTIKNESASDAKQFLKLIGDSIDISDMTAEEVKSYQDAINKAMEQGKLTLAEGSALMSPITDAVRDKTKNFIDAVAKGILGTATSKDIDDIRKGIRERYNLSDEDMKNITFEDDGKGGIKLTKDSVGWLMTHFPEYMEDWVDAWNQEVGDTLKKEEKKTRGVAEAFVKNTKLDAYNDRYTATYEGLQEIFSTAEVAMDNEWVKTLKRTHDGQYIFSALDLEKQGIHFSPEVAEIYERSYRELSLAAEKELASNFSNIISTVMEQGVDAIDWREYEDLDPKIVEMIKGDANLSKADFAAKYATVAGKTLKEANALLIEGITADEEKTRGMYEIFSSSVKWDPYYELFSASGDTLASIFSSLDKLLTKEWLDTLERDHNGNYKVSMQDFESQGIVFDASLFPEYERYLQEQAKAREEEIANGIGNMISTFVDQGFNAIDFRDYYDLPSEVIDDIKASSEMSKRDFVAKFAQAAGKTVSEMNAMYFEAWEKDIGLDATEAAKNMLYYKNGGMSGSSSDWTAMLGDAVKVSDLVRSGLLEYNEVLGTYYTNNFAEIQKIAGLDIDSSVINDSMREAFLNIADTLEQGLNGALSGMDAKAFKERLNYMGLGNVQLDFTETAEGLQLSQQSAISLYTELKKIDGLQAQLVFNKLKDSLELSNDKYKTMTSILKNIKELLDAINNAENYSDEKIRQYREELALAKEIAAVRATSEDNSFNFLDRDIPGAMKNPLNYVNSWVTAWKELRNANKELTTVDFSHMYNMLHEINDLAALTGDTLNFMGVTLDGSFDAINQATDTMIAALGSDNSGNYGVILSKFGEGLKLGVDSYAQSADTAIHAMARSLMEIIGALIKIFETIVALEEFEGADIDLNGILSLDEIFSDAQELGDKAYHFTQGYLDVAKILADRMASNGELAAAFESVKINGVSLAEIIRDATDGIKDVNISADEYKAAISALYKLAESGDFDINNIAASLHEELMKVGKDFHGTIEYGDFIIDLSYNVTIKKKDGKYITSSGAEYDNYGEALAAEALENAGIKNLNITTYLNESTGKYEASGTLTIANMEIEVVAANGAVHYNVDGTECATLAEALKAVWDHQKDSGETTLDYTEWRIDLGIVVYGTITDVKLEPMSKQLVEAAVGVTYELIQEEFNEASRSDDPHNELLKLSAKYGVDFTKVENFDEKDWENFKTLIGVESKNVEVTASVSANSDNPGLLELIEEGGKTVNIDANTEAAKTALENYIKLVRETSESVTIDAITSDAETALGRIQDALDNLSKVGTIKIQAEFEDVGGSMAKGTGMAMAAGTKTLMGELGPELYVANGHYYIAGLGGAEFVNLPKDAIVFNHLLTKQLMGSGISGRGKPITNERNAVAMATGALGPAMANAKAVLATLKQLYAMWSNLANSSILDLAGLGGTGGGGANNIDSWIRKVEKWYNLLLEIAALEKEINYEEALRNKIMSDFNPNVKEFHESTLRELEYRRKQALTKQELADSYALEYEELRAYYNSNNSPFSQLYTYDERGQIKYKDGTLAKLSEIFALSANGKPINNPEQQWGKLREALGKDAQGRSIADIYSTYNADGSLVDLTGTPAENASRRLQAVFSHIDAEQGKMQELYDSAHNLKIEALEAQTEANNFLREMNSKYFEVWEKAMKTLVKLAAGEIQYTVSGKMYGSGDNWSVLLDGLVDVNDLVEAGALAYNEKLQAYVVENIETLLAFGIDASLFDKNRMKDSIRTLFNNILDMVDKGLNSGLTNIEVGQLMENLKLQDIDLDLTFDNSLEGLKLSLESAIALYQELKSVDAILGRLMFDKLRTSLEQSNDKYKTMSRLLNNIIDLEEKINNAEKYNDAKIKQYREELDLAIEIAQIRATTEDDSMNFLDADIPGAFNNPLNYMSNMVTMWKELREAAHKDTPVDFKHMYNFANQVNEAARRSGQALDFFGYTLDGSAEKLHAALMGIISAMGSDKDGNYGVLLSKLGDSLINGVDGYANTADTALHTMAETLIKILDSLIQLFESIVAMENFEGADINLNGILDFDEIFDDAQFEADAEKFSEKIIESAQTVANLLTNNPELDTALLAVTIGPYTLKDIILDALNGVRELNINAKEYAAALSVFFELTKSQDYDLSNAADSWMKVLALNKSGFNGAIGYGDFNITPEEILAKIDEALGKGEDGEAPSASISVDANTEAANTAVEELKKLIEESTAALNIDADTTLADNELTTLVQSIKDTTAEVTVKANVEEANNTISGLTGETTAPASATGNAMAKGTRTLMGELGPELYVTGGHYYIAGRNGAEFINLPDDAIVFNHLLTLRLLGFGTSGRGRAITNESNAVSMAAGSLGPAAANAEDTLNMLKQLRAMWQNMLNSSIVDLAGMGGNNISSVAGWVDEVERWYNLLLKIAQLEKEINYEEALRRKMETDRFRDGAAYYNTLEQSYNNYIELANAHRELYESQLKFFEQRRNDLNNAPIALFYTYDKNGLLKFKEGGYSALADLLKQYDTGEVKYSAIEQYNILKSLYGNLVKEYGSHDSSGKKLDPKDFTDGSGEYEKAVVQAIMERIEKERQEMQSLHDSIEEHKISYLEALTSGNEILLKVVDNLITVENNVLAAIEEREQAIIDELSDLRDAMKENTDRYIAGLNDALSKERNMYLRQDDASELNRLERLLAILRRSGGSASQIRSLESLILDKRRDEYFALLEDAIASAQEAAELELEKLDEQIELMTTTLEFEKAHGMLWAEVAQIMSQSSDSILAFLVLNTGDYLAKSLLLLSEQLREWEFEILQWTTFRDKLEDTIAEGMKKGTEAVAEERYNPADFSTEKITESKSTSSKTTITTSATNTSNNTKISTASKNNSSTPKFYGGANAGRTKEDKAQNVITPKPASTPTPTLTQIPAATPTSTVLEPKNSTTTTKPIITTTSKTTTTSVVNPVTTKPTTLSSKSVNDKTSSNNKLLQVLVRKVWVEGDPSLNVLIAAINGEIVNQLAGIKWYENLILIASEQLAKFKAAGVSTSDAGWIELEKAQSDARKIITEAQLMILTLEARKAQYMKEIGHWEERRTVLPYKNGGIIDYTGLAMVHGSKEEPEAILNSKDYKLWKQSIGSNVWESLERERLEMQALHDTFNSVITNSSDSSIVIEKAEVNVNVEQIANDYDAKRMGELALQEMVRIARKTGTATIRR